MLRSLRLRIRDQAGIMIGLSRLSRARAYVAEHVRQLKAGRRLKRAFSALFGPFGPELTKCLGALRQYAFRTDLQRRRGNLGLIQ